MTEISKKIAKDLLKIQAVFLSPDKPFTWASGIKSPVYCDNRLTLTAPEVRTDVENGLKALIEENYPDAEVLMGTSTARHCPCRHNRAPHGTSHGLCPLRQQGSRQAEPH